MAEEPVRLRVLRREDGGERIFADLSPSLAHAYEASVRGCAPRLERRLIDGVIASRVQHQMPRPFAFERSLWRRAIGDAVRPGRVVVRSDVRDCFPSISVDTVAGTLADLGVDARPVVGVLETCRHAGVRGLPVGPWPSSVLANAVLLAADLAAQAAGARVLRWVDDVALVCEDGSIAVRAFDAWAAALRGRGLDPHEGKTTLLGGEEARVSFLGGTSLGEREDRGMLRPP